MPLPGSHRIKPKPLQEIVNDGQQEFLQEVNIPQHEETTVEEQPKSKKRARRSKKK